MPTFVGGAGSHLIDADGRRYLDFSSQLVFANLGHQHPRIVEAIKEQADRLCTLAPAHASDIRGEAARLIVDVAPHGLGHVLFTTSGTEAIEHAVRMARLHTGRPKVLAAYRSYHGSTTTSIHLTGDPRRWASDTGAAGVVHFFGPFLYRSAFGSSTPEEECARALAHLEQVILLEGPSTISALVLEPVTGSSGVIVPPPGYLRGVRELCTRHGIVFIADEVLVGFGRTGAWFGVDHDGVAPDLLVFAKGVNSGYVPLGGVLVGDPIFETFTDRPYPAGMTYSGHPLACAAAVGAIGAMHDEGTVAAAARLGTTSSGPGSRGSPRTTLAWGTSAASVRSGRSNWCATGRPRSRSCRRAPRARRTRPWRRSPRPASTAICSRWSSATASTSRRRSTERRRRRHRAGNARRGPDGGRRVRGRTRSPISGSPSRPWWGSGSVPRALCSRRRVATADRVFTKYCSTDGAPSVRGPTAQNDVKPGDGCSHTSGQVHLPSAQRSPCLCIALPVVSTREGLGWKPTELQLSANSQGLVASNLY